MSADSRGIMEHLEAVLGPPAGGWSERGAEMQVARFEGRPLANATVYSTVGLSDTPLAWEPQPGAAETVRLELLFACYDTFAGWAPEKLLFAVSHLLRERGTSFLRGDVLGPAGPLFEGTRMEALYAAPPLWIPEERRVLPSSNPPTAFVWLLPIHRLEAEYRAAHGYAALETLLQRQEVDLLDLRRAAAAVH